MPRVLVIDDDSSFREVMLFHLQEEGIEADSAPDGARGLKTFDPAVHHVVVTDLKMPRMDGMAVLRKIKERSPSTVVLVISAFGTIEKAVEAMKMGAFDFIPKPCTRDHFKLAVKKALEHHRLENRVQELEHLLKSGSKEMVFRSALMAESIKLIDKMAMSNATVLITGESGTGKELFAQRLHRKSPRINSPFVAVNCGAIPKELMESELFGHAKGAFTGAMRDRKGKFELANKGTLFLDEISEISIELQTKLLRVLAEQIVDVVGKERSVPVDVRIVAATNRNLLAGIEAGTFREDLYYRLNVFQVEIPPLRKRIEDVPLLAEHFLRQYAPNRELVLADETKKKLMEYSWPGNVRELENICQRIALLTEEEEVFPDMLPPFHQAHKDAAASYLDTDQFLLPEGGLSLVDLEKNVIVQALAKNHYNQSRTAKYLRIPRHILLYRLEKYGIEQPKKS